MAERRAKGLCMFCDEVFTPGHQLKHKRVRLYVVELEGEEEEETAVVDVNEGEATAEPYILVNAINGTPHFQTMRVTGYHGRKPLHILIDSGSTHNFIDEHVVKKIGCRLEAMKPMAVAVDGNRVFAIAICRQFTWQLHSTTYAADCMVLPLGFCNVVLGIQWLSTLGPILWDFQQLMMEFKVEGRRHGLRGATPHKLKSADSKQMSRILAQGS
uniref:Uncharacterized protein n=1 Tax=Nelumbo nucifera TaxID=4432 RepID=A0A822Y4V6_NELNU|nr:TPA_asm: hypothetical protein HUJ06_030442 [Nelumbo nucifera]